MKLFILLIILRAVVTHLAAVQPVGDVYSVWAEPNLHIMMCDNGTPDDPEDDWVVDWEDNRDVTVIVND